MLHSDFQTRYSNVRVTWQHGAVPHVLYKDASGATLSQENLGDIGLDDVLDKFAAKHFTPVPKATSGEL